MNHMAQDESRVVFQSVKYINIPGSPTIIMTSSGLVCRELSLESRALVRHDILVLFNCGLTLMRRDNSSQSPWDGGWQHSSQYCTRRLPSICKAFEVVNFVLLMQKKVETWELLWPTVQTRAATLRFVTVTNPFMLNDIYPVRGKEEMGQEGRTDEQEWQKGKRNRGKGEGVWGQDNNKG